MIRPREALEIVQRPLLALRRAVVAEVEDLNRLIYHVLRGGVILSLSFVLFAVLMGLLEGQPLPERAVPSRELLAQLGRLSPDGLMTLGILCLILTPVARVFLSFVSFVEEREGLFMLVTAIVLANLLLSLALGMG